VRETERAARHVRTVKSSNSELPLPSPFVSHLLAIAVISAVAGSMNAIAGGGTLLTFPALIGLGIPPLVANATSTVGLLPASVSSMWGYRRELEGARHWVVRFSVPSLLGGLVGAILLVETPANTFSRLVPWLVLGATALFIAQGPITARLRGKAKVGSTVETSTEPPPTALLIAFQFLVSIYGGYFGAGVGILMLAALGLMGLTNIHRMNGLKNWGGFCMNAVAVVVFAVTSLVAWPVALTMAAGSLGGGYVGSRVAQRVGQRAVRFVIATIGICSGIWLMVAR
jgi:uncharacterized membrane protein YfcA